MEEEKKKPINKSLLTKEEMKELIEKTKNLDKKQSHYLSYRTMMNEIRRELLKFIGCEIRTIDDIKNEFEIDEDQLLYHLSMLEQCYYIINSTEGWKSTPGGIAFLENAKMGEI
jgi:predicted transcriptional regulator